MRNTNRHKRAWGAVMIGNRLSIALLWFGLAAFSMPLGIRTALGEPPAAQTDQLQTDLESVLRAELSRAQHTTGASLCVKFPDGDPISAVAGRNILGAAGRGVLASDTFRLASMSETYLASLSLLAASDPRLQLDRRFKNYLPATLPANRIPNGRLATGRQLLAMRSGIPDYLELE